MAGRRHKDFRSGDLNEELGTLLLKAVAAVASVPRPEDVGIDAVATLLCEGPHDLLVAEDSFFVQFKSSSARTIIYRDHEVRWLERLKLPYFIGSVRKHDSAMDLFATHRLSQAILENQYEEIELLLDPHGTTLLGADPNTEGINNGRRRINIGPPLLSWSTSDSAEPAFAQAAIACLKPYLEAEQRNIDYRGIRYIELIQWETGGPPRCQIGSMHYQHIGQGDLHRIFRSMAPHMHALSTRASMTRNRTPLKIVVELIDYMRRCGFDADPMEIHRLRLSSLDEVQ